MQQALLQAKLHPQISVLSLADDNDAGWSETEDVNGREGKEKMEEDGVLQVTRHCLLGRQGGRRGRFQPWSPGS